MLNSSPSVFMLFLNNQKLIWLRLQHILSRQAPLLLLPQIIYNAYIYIYIYKSGAATQVIIKVHKIGLNPKTSCGPQNTYHSFPSKDTTRSTKAPSSK